MKLLPLIVLLWASVGYGDETALESLLGLEGVGVAIEPIEPDAEKGGLTMSQLWTDVQFKLLKAGIRVLTSEEWLNAPGKPYLYARVNVAKSSEIEFYGYLSNQR